MVMKPSDQANLVPAPLSQATHNPPYPTTPSDEYPPQLPATSGQPDVYSPDPNSSPAFRVKPQEDTLQQKKDDNDSDYSDLSDWDKSDDEDDSPEFLPDPLKIGGGKPLPASGNKNALPDALRAGPPTGVPIQKPANAVTPEPTGATSTSWGGVSNSSAGSIPLKTNNPYLKMQSTGQSNYGGESSQSVWGDAPVRAQEYGELVELPSYQTPDTPTNKMANLSMTSNAQTQDSTPSSKQLPHEAGAQDKQQSHEHGQHSSHTGDPWTHQPSQGHVQQQPSPQPSLDQLQQPIHQAPVMQSQQIGQQWAHHDPSAPVWQATEPWTQQRHPSIDQPPLIAVESATPQSAHPRHESNASDIWSPGTDISSLDAYSRGHGLPPDSQHQETPQRTWQEQQAWEQSERERKQREVAAAHEAVVKAEQERHHEQEYHRAEQAATFTPDTSPEEPAPSLPPRRQTEEQAPPMPPRPINTGVGTSSQAGPESPNTVMNKQRREHYQIKHIRWFDASTRTVRNSPILTQNINGPCPLLALVNALSLSTPAGVQTEFIETLRTREQVSLGLLLDAVFEELMSGRRGGAARELPDVNALYTFLLGLHTGLNVNPMFVQDPTGTDGLSTLTPGLATRPGGFENTRDMKLYRTFDIPLFHGWLPEAGSDAYIAFDRVAKTYESAMIVQFQLEELDAKLQAGGLSPDEQRLFTDIHAIQEFLGQWASQLSTYGLRTIQESLKPGQVAILFRNDHFSTLYKNPHTNELMTLVTDQGYSTHDEIVWESLVDISGQGSELYSGDFRAVGNNSNPQRQQHQQPVQSLLDIDDNQGWTTVPGRNRSNQGNSSSLAPSNDIGSGSPTSETSRTEQEDHDLALALQLQEEEDDRHRRSLEERRRRENQLSETAISSQSQGRPNNNRRASRNNEQPPMIPPRRNNVQTHRPNNEAAPPPTYEEAATNPPYHPPQGHPANSNAPFRAPGSAYQTNTSNMSPGQGGRRPAGRPMSIPSTLPGRPGRRQSAGATGPNGEDRDKCVVM